MNTFWLKIAGVAVVVVAAMILVGQFTGDGESKPEEPLKGITDQWAEDSRRLNAEPQFREPPVQQATTQTPASAPAVTVTPVNTTVTVQQAQPVEVLKPEFEKLSMEDDFQAQKLWAWVENQRKMGRLPVMTFGQMVKTCREIISRWPASEYAFKAKRALGQIPERHRRMYNVTDEEIDLGNLK